MSNQINIICISGKTEKLQMAAMIASVNVAMGEDVTIFFSMDALTYFIKGNTKKSEAESDFGILLGKEGVPSYRQLFQQSADLGDAKLLPCSMALDLLEITADDLEPEFGPATGLTKFLSDAEGGQIYTF